MNAALAIFALPALLACGYLLLLAAASRRRAAPPAAPPSLRFDIVVPAHDEESGIARTVHSLLSQDYPAELRRVLVVADNCRDATEPRAIAAGATVLVRDDRSRCGKGHALAFAFEHSLRDAFADAVVVVDADSIAPRNLLQAFAARLQRGALAVQAGSAVLNRDDSWRTRLMAVALALFNGARSLARENLGLSCGLRGNGMCFASALLRAQPYRAFSAVEDLEFGVQLGRAGIRVRYAGEASVASAMVSSARAAGPQRRRWEAGRAALARELGWPLVREALRKRSLLLLDLAIDLLVPPLSTLALAVAAGCAASTLASAQFALVLWLSSFACLAVYFVRGWQLSGIGLRGLGAMAFIPFYVLWKLSVVAFAQVPVRWERTAREGAR